MTETRAAVRMWRGAVGTEHGDQYVAYVERDKAVRHWVQTL
ncbi:MULTISPECIES: hypothetical protein [unclassified Microbacterium]|nr:hypothetical protein [Microbacterium sp. ABRD28]